MRRMIGVDIGGTNIVCGLVDEQGKVLKLTKFPTEAHQGSDAVIGRLAEAIRTLCREEGLSPDQLAAVGAGVPGFVDPEHGLSVQTVNLGWRNLPFASQLSAALQGVPVFIDNDVRMYVYGEAAAGAGKGFKHVLGVTLGTGLAAAVVSEGRLYYGGGYLAGELGHIPMDGISYRCGCGQVGCLETVASGRGMERQLQEALAQGRPTVVRQWIEEGRIDAVTAQAVSQGYDAGDSVCREIMSRTGRLLGRGLATAVCLLSPDVIIIGGGAAAAGERLFAPMREELDARLLPIYKERLTVTAAQRLEDAGVAGSALMALSRLGR